MRLFEDRLIDELAAKAAASPRKRAHLNVHESAADLVQRFFVVAQPDSYFRPHMHRTHSELAVVLRGRLDLLTFDESGRVLARYDIGKDTGQFAYETASRTWHTLVPVGGPIAFLEIKQGPYDPAVAVDFAPWAPPEADPAVPRFQRWLQGAPVGAIYSA